MKISNVIPCTPTHFLELGPRLDDIVEGTRVPEEIVISLSNAHMVSLSVMEKMEKEYSQKVEKFTLLQHNKTMTHGPNRQAGSEKAFGDLIIYQDADDIIHPRRLEIIEYFFENYDIVHLNHGWVPPTISWDKIKFLKQEEMPYFVGEEIYNCYFPNDNFLDCSGVTRAYGGEFGAMHGGNTSILKNVLGKVRWKDWNELRTAAEDYEFCMEVCFQFKKSMMLNYPLIYYTNGDPSLTLDELGYEFLKIGEEK